MTKLSPYDQPWLDNLADTGPGIVICLIMLCYYSLIVFTGGFWVVLYNLLGTPWLDRGISRFLQSIGPFTLDDPWPVALVESVLVTIAGLCCLAIVGGIAFMLGLILHSLLVGR